MNWISSQSCAFSSWWWWCHLLLFPACVLQPSCGGVKTSMVLSSPARPSLHICHPGTRCSMGWASISRTPLVPTDLRAVPTAHKVAAVLTSFIIISWMDLFIFTPYPSTSFWIQEYRNIFLILYPAHCSVLQKGRKESRGLRGQQEYSWSWTTSLFLHFHWTNEIKMNSAAVIKKLCPEINFNAPLNYERSVL